MKHDVPWLMAYWVCESRGDLRAKVLDGTWGGEWKNLTFFSLLSSDDKSKIKASLESSTGSHTCAECAQNLNVEIDKRWDPPCPANDAINAAFNAMLPFHPLT